MTRSTVRRLTKPLDEPEREFQRLRRAAWRLHQNESLAIARRNLFDDEASSSNDTETKSSTPLKTLREHSLPNSSGFQNPIILSTERTGRIVDSRNILLIQGTCTFQGLKSEDPLRHIKHYLSIVDNILADEATRDTSRLQAIQPTFRGRLKMACKRKEKGEDSPEWVVRNKFEDELANFMLEKKLHMKGIGEMLDQHHKEMHEQFSQILSTIGESKFPEPEAPTFAITTKSGINTRDLPFPTLLQSTPTNHAEGTTEREVPEGAESSAMQNEEALDSYQSTVPKSYDPYGKGSQVLEMDEDELVLIILGRPFLATARAVIDVRKGKLKNQLKPSSVKPPKLELKKLPEHLEYAFLQENNQLPLVISSALSTVEKTRLLEVLKNHKGAITWNIADIKGIDSSFCTHKILMEDEFKPSVQPQRRVNPNIKEVVKKEVIRLLD
ncbi:hypothetical protein Tco_0783482, partial [Tanacetum coccineum]